MRQASHDEPADLETEERLCLALASLYDDPDRDNFEAPWDWKTENEQAGGNAQMRAKPYRFDENDLWLRVAAPGPDLDGMFEALGEAVEALGRAMLTKRRASGLPSDAEMLDGTSQLSCAVGEKFKEDVRAFAYRRGQSISEFVRGVVAREMEAAE